MNTFQRPNTVEEQPLAGALAGCEREKLHTVASAASRQIVASDGHAGFAQRPVYAQHAVYLRTQRFRSVRCASPRFPVNNFRLKQNVYSILFISEKRAVNSFKDYEPVRISQRSEETARCTLTNIEI